jgi:hypothetical protein
MTDATTEKDQRNESSGSSLSTSNTRTEILLTPTVTTDADSDSKRIHDHENDKELSPDIKRVKGQVWLQYRGKRQTRVGDNYQVNVLPKPSE